jgi:hypothetical protein
LVAEPDDRPTPTFAFVSLSDFEEHVLRGGMNDKAADKWVAGTCPKCKRPYKETGCVMHVGAKGCSFCHLQSHVVKNEN